ncbi:MAG: hypothetical protein HYY67_01455 [Thaumarchaeota archaeon]|nr:hypothetical protein [Nitrososphaerota archaeon]
MSDSDAKVSIGYSLGGSIKYCPYCLGKLRIADSIGGWLIPADYECSNCGYRGSVALERNDSESIS